MAPFVASNSWYATHSKKLNTVSSLDVPSTVDKSRVLLSRVAEVLAKPA